MAGNSAPDIRREIQAALKGLVDLRDRRLPIVVGTEAVKHVRENFRKGGVGGRKWKDPLRRTLSFQGVQGRYGPLLSRNNRLMDATQRRIPRPGQVIIENRLPYATIHNEGGTITVTHRMKRYFWWRYLQITGSKGTRGRKPIESRYRLTKKGQRGNNEYNRGLDREAEFWKSMALKRVGTRIRMPQRMFIGTPEELDRIVEDAINRQLQKYIRDYGTRFGRSH